MSESRSSQRMDFAIFIVIAAILIALVVILGVNLAFQHGNYRSGIEIALTEREPNHSAMLGYSRAWDFAVVKTSALFMSFLLIFSGALYLFRNAEVQYGLSGENKDAKVSLTSSSPGLVMVTLGVFLVAFVINKQTTVGYRTEVEIAVPHGGKVVEHSMDASSMSSLTPAEMARYGKSEDRR